MVKRRQGFSGLSAFVKKAFEQNEHTVDTPPDDPVSLDNGPSTSAVTSQADTSRKASQLEQNDQQTSPDYPSKKRKIGLLGSGLEKYDATGLVPFYTDPSEVPERLSKYFFQRTRYFSLYAEGCLLDSEGWYSVTPELIANQIAERCRCMTILDAFCGVGGNAIAFAKTFIAIDTSPIRLALARHNAAIYGVEDRIEFILGDYISFARSYLTRPSRRRNIDVVFLSPPWGGPEYLTGVQPTKPTSETDIGLQGSDADRVEEQEELHPEFTLSQIQPIHGAELFHISRQITKNIAYFLPRNTNLNEISSLVTHAQTGGFASGKEKEPEVRQERVEVEEEWMGSKLKALTCYFGGLASGQEDMFDDA
ncbi:hypothetical protein PHLCEN_2v13094 [Hermanssonia centrifuga]|uniref:Trimethylguanosine synthase n=1 Tax=Hermanssonia centrifuga TaxID=98765 RepID=A0A2R6NFC3_9APHY|nr:hypothetical protein PHLCEN_2v13094 [Hermanssonia centrifuga]